MRVALPILLALALAASAAASPISKHDRDVVRFFQHHPRLARTPAGGQALAALLPRVIRALQAAQSINSPQALAGHWRPPWPPESAYPAWFRHDAACIEMGESTDGAGSSNLYGMLDGWGAAGGQDSAWSAAPGEQLYRVWVLQHMDGWSPWATAAGCGL